VDLGIQGKLAVVTGGSRGLGLASARGLAREGCRLALIARDKAAIEKAARDLEAEGAEAIGIAADLTDRPQIEAALDEIAERSGAPEILVYNNSAGDDVFFDDATDEQFRYAYETLVMGFTWCVRKVVPAMKEAGWGRIVTLGSLCAREPHRAFPYVLHNLGRPAQVGLSKTLANELGGSGITVNTVGTGMIDHDGEAVKRSYMPYAEARGMDFEEVQAYRTSGIPLGRTGTGEELAAACVFLCSEPAAFITGQMLLVDGGRVASLM
jgi:NAD(P)-dependent dehydrogenase (short-subunit alcohol dehydrogenase family)